MPLELGQKVYHCDMNRKEIGHRDKKSYLLRMTTEEHQMFADRASLLGVSMNKFIVDAANLACIASSPTTAGGKELTMDTVSSVYSNSVLSNQLFSPDLNTNYGAIINQLAGITEGETDEQENGSTDQSSS
jgi:hypothetical protein